MFENKHLPGLGALLAGSEPCTPSPAQRNPTPVPPSTISSGSEEFVDAQIVNGPLMHGVSLLDLNDGGNNVIGGSSIGSNSGRSQLTQRSNMSLSERERLLALREEEVHRREREMEQAHIQRFCGIEQFLEPESTHPNSFLGAAQPISRHHSFETHASFANEESLTKSSLPMVNKADLSIKIPNNALFPTSAITHPLPKRPVVSSFSFDPSHQWNNVKSETPNNLPASELSWSAELSAGLHQTQQRSDVAVLSAASSTMARPAPVLGNLFTTPPETPHMFQGDAMYNNMRPLQTASGVYNYPSSIGMYNQLDSMTQTARNVMAGPYRAKMGRVPNAAFDLSADASEFVLMPGDKSFLPENFAGSWGRSTRYNRSPGYMTGQANWHQLVKRIITNNDQQASILLQQKIKNASTEDKFDMCQAILDDTLNLASNRFGNFLVQRCMEYGSPEQVTTLAAKLTGHVVDLSKDSFGCHVMQKALDIIPEHYKRIFVQEMLVDIRTTIIHRYACHVWQKLFELRWEGTPPQIMSTVNEQLTDIWTEVALGETGSLVVQNIFENCVEEDKRACITEVLDNIDIIARGQFGNWCIQHICENGSDHDRARALENIIDNAASYSTDQFGSKVVEKCLKVAGLGFVDNYLRTIAYKADGRVRSALIDIAGDQYGNYLIQWILSNASTSHRELVATQVRQHMVSLRGSKYGARVAVMCGNPVPALRTGRSLHRGTSFPR